ncbi:TPA: hypothetical protein DDZ86_04740, partial [Candidatus Dependentiae bacterium]|nr:hypothetical protein [Candidatus Dependentiae bacterium]
MKQENFLEFRRVGLLFTGLLVVFSSQSFYADEVALANQVNAAKVVLKALCTQGEFIDCSCCRDQLCTVFDEVVGLEGFSDASDIARMSQRIKTDAERVPYFELYHALNASVERLENCRSQVGEAGDVNGEVAAQLNELVNLSRGLLTQCGARAPRPGLVGSSETGPQVLYPLPRDINVAGDIHADGTISAGNFDFSGDLTVAGTIDAGSIVLHNDLTVPGTLTAGNIAFTGDLTVPGNLVVDGATTLTSASLTNHGQLNLYEANGSGSNYIALQAPITLAGNYTLTLPPTTGTNGYVLTTDGAGVLSWAPATGGGFFAQGGNAFGATAVLGTTDVYGLDIKTEGVNRISIANTAGNGVITASGALYADAGVDVTHTSGGSDTLNIGTNNANIINLGTGNLVSALNIGSGAGATTITIGGPSDTVNIGGVLTWIKTTGLEVTDKLVTINKGGIVASGNNAGIEIEEGGVITAYADTSNNRNSWVLKAPATTGVVTITPGASGFALNQGVSITDSPVFVGLTLLGMSVPGVVHNNAAGLLSSSLITGSDITAATITNDKLATVSSASNNSYIVARDSSGNFAANTITASLTGHASLDLPLAGGTLTGNLIMSNGDQVRLTQGNAGSSYVALAVPSTVTTYNLTLPGAVGAISQVPITTDAAGTLGWVTAVSGNTASALVQRDASGNFSAGTISAALAGHASLDLPLTGGTLTGNLVMSNGNQVRLTQGSAGLNYVALGAPSSVTNYTLTVPGAAGSLNQLLVTTDTAGTLGWVTAATGNTASTLVQRDPSGNFAAGTITAALTGASSLNVLKTGDTMTGNLVMSNGNQVRLTQGSAGSNYVALGVPSSVTNYTLTMPGA